jgi:phospholipid/cholesterol/gamma-HCH transport system ATP-binding protein
MASSSSTPPRFRPLRWLDAVGRRAVGAVEELGLGAAMVGESLYWLVLGPSKKQPVRPGSVAAQMMEIGIQALPIVTLMAATIGAMLAIQGIHTLKLFGAESRVAIGIAFSMVREFGPLITGILVAGRSGSALAARLGTMKINQEVDALKVMGINPVRYLVVPALLAMLIMLPCLTFYSMIVGLLGGGALHRPGSRHFAGRLHRSGDRYPIARRSDARLGQERPVRGADRGHRRRQRRVRHRRRGRRRQGYDPRRGAVDFGHRRHRHDLRLRGDAMTAPAAADAPVNVIEVKDLVTHYGERMILKGVSMEVRQGEVMVIMGGSGSGKSTLLRHLMALERHTSGSMTILGTDIDSASAADMQALRKRMGVAFQSGALFSSMTVGENIMLPLFEHTDLDRKTMDIMVRMKLEVVDLAGFEDLMPAELSGGMVKRAAFARAIVMDPRILFCDEPSAGLDPVVASALDDLILRMRDAMGMSIVVVTHELESVFKIADRVTVLDRGETLFIGTVEELRAHPSARIQNLINRVPEDEDMDIDAYMAP